MLHNSLVKQLMEHKEFLAGIWHFEAPLTSITMVALNCQEMVCLFIGKSMPCHSSPQIHKIQKTPLVIAKIKGRPFYSICDWSTKIGFIACKGHFLSGLYSHPSN
jgi:hypothetical protein